jgi:hypothetical protein
MEGRLFMASPEALKHPGMLARLAAILQRLAKPTTWATSGLK